ncbi:class I SAM-dependent methyltransferase [Pollutibacter soli]|uniref:class I SAM-dependent methyltransferase n=1 Tax=Pollutibacter soli TaxID=3034157 RepID=UPI003013B740
MTEDAQPKADLTGKDTLQSFSRAYRFNQWMFDQIAPWAKGSVFEAGSGIGNISKLFIEKGFRMVLSDIMSDYLTRLKRTFADEPNVDAVVELDLSLPQLHHQALAGRFDTVIALNVIEHIENDVQAVKNCNALLIKGGRLIMLVPAFQSLYNSFDKDLQHYRRYTKKTVTELLESNGYKVVHTQYFNFGGLIGWYISGSILRNKKIPRGQLRIFEKLVPLFRVIDKLIFSSAGVSVIAVAEKVSD